MHSPVPVIDESNDIVQCDDADMPDAQPTGVDAAKPIDITDDDLSVARKILHA